MLKIFFEKMLQKNLTFSFEETKVNFLLPKLKKIVIIISC